MRTFSTRPYRTLIALGILLLGLAACSEDDDPVEPAPITSEGTTADPVAVTVNGAISGRVGAGAEATSYYRFQTNVSGLYAIGVTEAASDLDWRLYGAGGFGGAPLETCTGPDDTEQICIAFLVDARADYNLAVENVGEVATTFELDVSGAQTMAPIGCDTDAVECFEFEDGQVPDAPILFTMSGDAPWIIDDADGTGEGRFSLRSGPIGDGETSCFEFTVPVDIARLGVNWMCQSEAGVDVLAVYIDGVLDNVYSGTEAWSSWTKARGAPAGTVYKFCYEKNGADSVGEDAAWLDDIWFR